MQNADTINVVFDVCDGIKHLTPNTSDFYLYPNPNDGTMYLDYALENDQQGIFIIYDLTGKQINRFTLTSSNSRLIVNEPNLSEGAYYYTISVDGKILYSDKLVIIK